VGITIGLRTERDELAEEGVEVTAGALLECLDADAEFLWGPAFSPSNDWAEGWLKGALAVFEEANAHD
jgi:hypothetical protein